MIERRYIVKKIIKEDIDKEQPYLLKTIYSKNMDIDTISL